VRILRSVVGAVVVAASLAACSVHPGAAAIVDGTVISQDELETAQRELAPILSGASPSDVLGVLIAAPDYVQAASDNGVGVSIEDAEALLASVAPADEGTSTPAYSAGSIEVARFSLATSKLQALDGGDAILADALAKVGSRDVTVNPRYGTFAADTGRVTLVDPDWIVQAPTQ